jgi:hypothetical protein
MPFQISIGHSQKDGRRYVLEVHTDAQGEFSRLEYLAAIGTDYDAVASAREPVLIASLAEAEARETLDGGRQPSPRFQSVAEFLIKVRERYRVSVGEETCRIARWVVDRLNDGSVTVPQMRSAFGVSAAGWNSINGRMDTFAAAIDSVNAAAGE